MLKSGGGDENGRTNVQVDCEGQGEGVGGDGQMGWRASWQAIGMLGYAALVLMILPGIAASILFLNNRSVAAAIMLSASGALALTVLQAITGGGQDGEG